MKKFDNYKKNLAVLSTAGEQDLTNEFILGGIIDKFYVQFEFAWKVMKELLVYEGVAAAKSGSPRAIIKEAYQFSSCLEEDIWLQMLSDRNDVTHTYNENIAKELVRKILNIYLPAFQELESNIEKQYKDILPIL